MPSRLGIFQNILVASAGTEAQQWQTSVLTRATAACWHRVGTRVSLMVWSSCRLSRTTSNAYCALCLEM